MTHATPHLKLAMDFVTLHNGPFWGLTHFNEFANPDAVPYDVYWDRALDVVGSTGLEGIEITGGVSSWRNALKRYGSAEAFASAAGDRGLELASAFYPGLMRDSEHKRNHTAWEQPARQEELLQDIAELADFVRDAGAEDIIIGLPMRKTWNDPEPRFIDLDYVQRLAHLLNRMGYIARTHGVRLSLHAEAHAVFWLRRDIDLFLALTDPVYVGFCPDTGQISMGGTNPVDVLADHYDRVSITHWKDATGPVSAHVPIDTLISASHHDVFARVGTGVIDWHAWTRKLREVNYSGWVVIELDAAADPVAELRTAREFVEAAALPIYR